MKKVIRHQIADYLNVGSKETPEYALMGAGFTALDENPNAKIEKTPYITDKSTSGTIVGYENSFPFAAQHIADDEAIRFIHNIARNQKTGEEAETDYVRVELYQQAEGDAYPARKFRVAVEVTSESGEGVSIVNLAGNLHQVGNFEDGKFDVKTQTFTANAAAASASEE